jgi:hypothetical protein
MKLDPPDYLRWNWIQPGMTKDRVRELIGSPADGSDDYTWRFGCLWFIEIACEVCMEFVVNFDGDGLVESKLDPFDGDQILTLAPSTPRLILPVAGAVFSHFPRIVDVRWQPPAGEHPMEYEIEVRICDQAGSMRVIEVESAVNQLRCVCEGALGSGDVRVRAKNAHGSSQWSTPRTFRFVR